MEILPPSYVEDEYEDQIAAIGGYRVPLNIFLYQEVQRLQLTISKCSGTMKIVMQAIKGEVVVTTEILDSINSIFDARVPRLWLYNPAGDELSWLSPTLGMWYGGLLQRDQQYRQWLETDRPTSFWLAGFFNPQGFLTAVQQEITRNHSREAWALDSVTLHTDVTDITKVQSIKQGPKEGVFIHGLFLDGASWSTHEATVVESAPKKLFSDMPVLFVTAVEKRNARKSTSDYGPYGGYECPVYKYPTRTDKYRIFMVLLPSRDHRPVHWTLRGVAMLCSTA
jgi:dynein heavy chain